MFLLCRCVRVCRWSSSCQVEGTSRRCSANTTSVSCFWYIYTPLAPPPKPRIHLLCLFNRSFGCSGWMGSVCSSQSANTRFLSLPSNQLCCRFWSFLRYVYILLTFSNDVHVASYILDIIFLLEIPGLSPIACLILSLTLTYTA